jgi:hypothetical protein
MYHHAWLKLFIAKSAFKMFQAKYYMQSYCEKKSIVLQTFLALITQDKEQRKWIIVLIQV